MSNLTQTAYIARRVIKYGSVGLIGFLVFWSISTAAIKAYRAAHPPYIAPTVRYGLLPRVVFPRKEFEKKNFSLELANDTFPKFKDQSRVYVVYRPTSSFLALQTDSVIAKELGFTSDPVEVSTGVYQFKNDTLNQTLTMNVLEGSFTLQYPYLQDQLLLAPNSAPTKEDAISSARSFLEKVGKFPLDLDKGDKKVTFWKIESTGLKSVNSQSDANIVRVDFFRESLENDFKIFSSKLNEAAVSVLVSGSTVESKQIVEVNYKYINIDRESFSTYPIKTPESAWSDLQAGNYWPLSDSSQKDIAIRRVNLGYFEPVTLTNFLQPIYIFEGDNNFVAFVPAVIDKWIQVGN